MFHRHLIHPHSFHTPSSLHNHDNSRQCVSSIPRSCSQQQSHSSGHVKSTPGVASEQNKHSKKKTVVKTSGTGIPVSKHRKEKNSALELVEFSGKNKLNSSKISEKVSKKLLMGSKMKKVAIKAAHPGGKASQGKNSKTPGVTGSKQNNSSSKSPNRRSQLSPIMGSRNKLRTASQRSNSRPPSKSNDFHSVNEVNPYESRNKDITKSQAMDTDAPRSEAHHLGDDHHQNNDPHRDGLHDNNHPNQMNNHPVDGNHSEGAYGTNQGGRQDTYGVEGDEDASKHTGHETESSASSRYSIGGVP